MRLKSLKISGFKSFNKSTTLGFSNSISAIVGPNGSGKSNVAESIAWVLGEQSVKNLRGKKGEDLIFNGSVSSPKMNKASVSLIFSKTPRRAGQEVSEEIVVSRTVYRDGVNEYFMNNTRARLKDIIEFLNKEGSGVVKHHIIRQGEADHILNSSIKERRDLIENALGLKIYKIKKEEAERKLLKTEENIEQVNSLRKEIQPHLRFLKKQVAKANESVELKEELKNICSEYFSWSENWINQSLEKIQVNLTEFNEKIEGKEKEIKSFEGEVKNFEKERERSSTIRNKISDLEREIGRHEGALFQMRKTVENKKEKTLNSQSELGKEEIKIRFSFREVENFAKYLEKEIERAFGVSDVESIKKILISIKKEARFLFKKPNSNQKEEQKENNETKESLKKMEAKYKELLVALGDVKKEEEILQKESRKVLDSERQLYKIKMEASELTNKRNNFKNKKEEFLSKKDFVFKYKSELEKFLKEKIKYNQTKTDVGNFSEETLERKKIKIERLRIKLEESGGVGEEMIKEYEEISGRDNFLLKETSDLGESSKSLRVLIKQLEERLDTDFKKGISKINIEFQKFFEAMFNGGKAELRIVKGKAKIVDEDSFQEEGVDIKVSLPRKKINSLGMLSGGERALTSIALLFALSQVNPPPFLILDETDAALDESNSRKYAQMLKKLSSKTQLILITHNRETMNIAGILYGVTMGGDGISKLLSIKLEDAEEMVV